MCGVTFLTGASLLDKSKCINSELKLNYGSRWTCFFTSKQTHPLKIKTTDIDEIKMVNNKFFTDKRTVQYLLL